MWVFTNFGFYSVVQHNKKPNNFLIRARSKDDLIRLILSYGEILNLSAKDIIVNDSADYRYRVEVDKSAWSNVISKISEDIDYYNFKDSVKDNLGSYRANLCHQVWDVMYELQESENNL